MASAPEPETASISAVLPATPKFTASFFPAGPGGAPISALRERRRRSPDQSDSAVLEAIDAAVSCALAGADERALALLSAVIPSTPSPQVPPPSRQLPPPVESRLAALGENASVSSRVRREALSLHARSREMYSDYGGALASFQRAFALAASPDLLCELASLTYRVVDANAAKKLLFDGTQRWPDDQAVRLLSAAFGVDDGAIDETFELIQQAEEADPSNVYAKAASARLALQLGEPDFAVVQARPVIAVFPALGRALLAVGLHRAGRLAEDPGLLDAVLANVPRDDWMLNQLAQALLSLERPKDALTLLNTAMRLAPNDRELRRSRGFTFMVLRRYEEAAFDFERAAVGESDAWLTAMRAESARMQGKAELAVELFESIEHEGQLEWVASSVGAALLTLNRSSEAREAFQRALAHDPDDVDALCGLGEIEIGVGLVESLVVAEDVLRRAVAVRPTSAKAQALLAEVLRKTNRLAEAIDHFDAALELSPTYIYALGSKGQALLALAKSLGTSAAPEMRKQGLELLVQALCRAPQTTWALDELFDQLSPGAPESDEEADALLRRTERAIRAGNEDENIPPAPAGDWAPVLIKRALLARARERMQQAVRMFRRAREFVPLAPDVTLEFASSLQETGQQSKALALLNEELLSHPDDSYLVWKRIEILWDLNRLPDARLELERLAAQEDPNPAACAALGEIYRVEGERAEARRLLEQAVDHDGNDAYALSSLGALDFDEGFLSRARQRLQRAMELRPENGFTQLMLVKLELEVGNTDGVREAIKRSETANPADREITLARALALFGLTDYVGALDVLEESLVSSGDDPKILRTRGWVELALTRSRMARISFLAAAELPDTDSSIVEVAISLTRVDEWVTALHLAQQAKLAGNAYAGIALAVVWMRAGRWKSARESILDSLELSMQSSESARIVVRALRLAGEPALALDRIQVAYSRWTTDQDIQFERGECLAAMGTHRQEADQAFQDLLARLARQAYRDADHYADQGRCLLKLGRGKEAAENLLRALSATDQNALILFDLVRASLLQGDVVQATAFGYRATQELGHLSVPTRRGLVATKILELDDERRRLEGAGLAEADRLTVELASMVGQLDEELDALLAAEVAATS